MAQNKIKFTTPVGRAQYPWLNTPDSAFGGEPKYKTNLIVENADDLMQLLEEMGRDEFGKKKFRLPIDTDEDTGEVVIKTKSNYAPQFFDSTGQVLTGKQIPQLRSGSMLRVGGFAVPYSVSGSAGISLRLTRVQIINPVGADGGSDGFDAVEGGYEAPEITEDDFNGEELPASVEEESASKAANRF